MAVVGDDGRVQLNRNVVNGSASGRAWLASLDLPPASRQVIDDDLALIDALTGPTTALNAQVRQRAKNEPGVAVLTQLPSTSTNVLLGLHG